MFCIKLCNHLHVLHWRRMLLAINRIQSVRKREFVSSYKMGIDKWLNEYWLCWNTSWLKSLPVMKIDVCLLTIWANAQMLDEHKPTCEKHGGYIKSWSISENFMTKLYTKIQYIEHIFILVMFSLDSNRHNITVILLKMALNTITHSSDS